MGSVVGALSAGLWGSVGVIEDQQERRKSRFYGIFYSFTAKTFFKSKQKPGETFAHFEP